MKTTILFAAFAVCLTQCVVANPTENSIVVDASEAPDGVNLDFKPAQNLIAAIYRRAMVSALQTKVGELHTKLAAGENAIPAAVDILKIALLSHPTQQTMRKAAEHVLGLMSPEMRKLAGESEIPSDLTTPMPKETPQDS